MLASAGPKTDRSGGAFCIPVVNIGLQCTLGQTLADTRNGEAFSLFEGCWPAVSISSFIDASSQAVLRQAHLNAPEWNGTAGLVLLADSITPKVSRDDLGDIKCAVYQIERECSVDNHLKPSIVNWPSYVYDSKIQMKAEAIG